MNSNRYDIYWENAKNWRWHFFYVCKDDPRIIVPKKPKWTGRTLNFAQQKAFVVLLLTVLAIAFPFTLLGSINTVFLTLLFLVIILGIVVFYYCFDLQGK